MMAPTVKRSWKLQDFLAHDAKVNCLALGHKSGRVMVTGGDDKKVKLWAIGKENCFMSLCGHLTPIECVQFDQLEELVCAGSRGGALKVWNLEAAKLVRTFKGHKQAIKCLDFHPYGELLGSGSSDSSVKIWDTRKKDVIYTYKGHEGTVNSFKFSPDGQWLASGGDDGTVKIWDLRMGKIVKEFNEHLSSVSCVEFHPREFLLATGGVDQTVNFFDLEYFNLVSSESELGTVRALCFNSEGDCLFTGVRDYLKIIGWEPSRLHDLVPVSWGPVCDVSIAQNQLVGASFHLTNVQTYMVDLKKCRPMGKPMSPGFELPSDSFGNTSLRKSFSKAERPLSLKGRTTDVKTIEENTSGTDPEEDLTVDITNVTDYNQIFGGRGLVHTPPPKPEPFQEPERDFALAPVVLNANYYDPAEPQVLADHNVTENLEALSLDNNINSYHKAEPPAISPRKYSRSKSNLDQVYLSRLTKQPDRENTLPNNAKTKPASKFNNNLQRQSSVKESSTRIRTKSQNEGIKHSVSDVNVNRGLTTARGTSRRNSFSKPVRNVPNVTAIKNNMNPPKSLHIANPHPEYSIKKLSPDDKTPEEEEFVPSCIDRTVGVDFDDFLPKGHDIPGFTGQLTEMSEAEALSSLMRGHQHMMSILATRKRNARMVFAHFRNKDMKSAVESAVLLEDLSSFVDILNVINTKATIWNLDLCVVVLPKLLDLLQSKYEHYMTVGCTTLKLILRHFGSVIRTNIQSPVGSYGVDITREERYQKSVKCHEMLSQLRGCVAKKLSLPGAIGSTFKEVHTMMITTLD